LLEGVIEQLKERRDQLWNRWIPDMLGGYFADLCHVIAGVMDGLNELGQCWIVVGDSRYAGVVVPVADVLRELAESKGWRVAEVLAIRHMKSSAQQGWRQELAETLMKLRPH
jgi:hypothetical protein